MSKEIYEEDYLNFYDSAVCIGDLGEKWCTFKWRIYDLQLNPKIILQSPIFSTRLLPNLLWCLDVKLWSPGNLKTMEIVIRALENHTFPFQNYPLTIDFIYKVISDGEIQISSKCTSVYCNEPNSGEVPFLASFHKPKKGYLTIECKLRPNKKMIRDVRHPNLCNCLPIHFRQLLQSGELCDTIIHVGNHRLMAHIAILHARLPNLVGKCLAPTKEDGKYRIKVDDLPLSVVKEMLKYAYTGQACVDLESASMSKDILVPYGQKFVQRCCWDDHPLAQTSFNYETDSLRWNLDDVFVKSFLGCKSVHLLRLHESRISFSLRVDESEKDKQWLVLSFEFHYGKTSKPIIVSCTSFLDNYKNVKLVNYRNIPLGETETLLQSDLTRGEVKLCSLLDVKDAKASLCSADCPLTLITYFKICYGSSKSSIENLYEGQFDISQCSGCSQLSADMVTLFGSKNYHDIILESGDGHEFHVHKAILWARCPYGRNINLSEHNRLIYERLEHLDLQKHLLKYYKGSAYV